MQWTQEYFWRRLNCIYRDVNRSKKFSEPVLFPVHPRTKPIIDQLYEKYCYQNILFVEPIGYLDMLFYTKNAIKIVTDSGGLQKEAYIMETDSVTVREETGMVWIWRCRTKNM